MLKLFRDRSLVSALPKVAGKREIRYVCLLQEKVHGVIEEVPAVEVAQTEPVPASSTMIMVDAERLAALERRVQTLEEKLGLAGDTDT